MIKKWLFLFLLMSCSAVFAAEKSKEPENVFVGPTTDDISDGILFETLIDGNQWMKFSPAQKNGFYFGFGDGVISTTVYFVPEEAQDKALMQTPDGLENAPGINEIIPQIDAFYSDKKNLEIPVSSVLMIVRNRALGVPEEKLQAYADHIRGELTKEETRSKLETQKDNGPLASGGSV